MLFRSKPDDAALKRGLDRARKKAGVAEKPVARAARPKVRTAKASSSDEGSTETTAAEDDSAKSAPPSAPPEPAADEQK